MQQQPVKQRHFNRLEKENGWFIIESLGFKSCIKLICAMQRHFCTFSYWRQTWI